MAKPVLLLGAGASMDAGVPGANALTQKVYDDLRERNFEDARLYGYVLGKLTTSRARKGVNPFSPIGIEDVYATLKRFLFRHADPLSEFVNSWDEFRLSPDFDAAKFHESLSRFVSQKLARDHRYAMGSEGPGAYLKSTFGSSNLETASDPDSKLRPFIGSLARCLEFDDTKINYVTELARFCASNVDFTATLNYDTLFEHSCGKIGVPLDFGLSSWNERKFVRFHGSGLRFAKLHGSTNWYEIGDDILIAAPPQSHLKRGMVFGAQSEKLVADGPYLQLRNQFEIALRKSNKIGVIGYSFQDAHVNSLLRIWGTTRLKAKMVILDPNKSIDSFINVGRWFTFRSEENAKHKVDVVHIRGTASRHLDQFRNELLSEPELNQAGRNLLNMRVVN